MLKKTPTFKSRYPFQLHFGLCLILPAHYKEKHLCLHALYSAWTTSCYNKNIADLSLTILVFKHNIQVSTTWFSLGVIWNITIISCVCTKGTGFNLPPIHFKIAFETHAVQHDIKNKSVLNYAFSPKVSFHLSLIGLKIRKTNSSLTYHYNCRKTCKIQTLFPQWFSPHENYKKLEELQHLQQSWSWEINSFSSTVHSEMN